MTQAVTELRVLLIQQILFEHPIKVYVTFTQDKAEVINQRDKYKSPTFFKYLIFDALVCR